MKILIINTDYPEFLKKLYFQFSDLDRKSYQEQLTIRNESLFGSSDFYSYNLEKLGHKAIDIHFNNTNIQSKWVDENINRRKFQWQLKKLKHKVLTNKLGRKLVSITGLDDSLRGLDFLEDVLKAQIEAYKPDIILNQSLMEVPVTLLNKIKNSNSKIVGQIASPLPSDTVLKEYDYLISSLPNQVAKFNSLGIPSSYLKLAFDERILHRVSEVERDLSIVFAGSITVNHQERVKLLEYLCENTDIKIWGSLHGLPSSSPIYNRYQGEAWGVDMYNVFRRAKIVLNNHIDIAENYANNMRLYEATGCGALLLTDYKANLNEIYNIDQEVMAYSSFSECLEKIEHFLVNEEERALIAKTGQEKTLQDHTYYKRMQEMIALFEKL